MFQVGEGEVLIWTQDDTDNVTFNTRTKVMLHIDIWPREERRKCLEKMHPSC